MNSVTSFFYHLSKKSYKENNLSDVLWAICKSNKIFQDLFIRFFFPDIELEEILIFEREVSEDDSRADFYIKISNEIYIIECKINDRNQHFEQYINAYSIDKKKLGYIVNYNLKKEGFEVKTWNELYNYLTKNIPERNNDKLIFEGFLEYLKNVCGIVNINKMIKINELYSTYSFDTILKSVLNKSTNDFTIELYESEIDTKDKMTKYRNGWYFSVSKEGLEKIWIWIGVYYGIEDPLICIEVKNKKGWGQPFFKLIEKSNEFIDNYATKPYLEEGHYWFEVSDKFYDEFNNSNSIDNQKDLLSKFIDEIVCFYIKLNNK